MCYRCTTRTKLNMISANFVVLAISSVHTVLGWDFSNIQKHPRVKRQIIYNNSAIMPIDLQIMSNPPLSDDPYGILESTSSSEASARKVNPLKRKRKSRKTTTPYPSNIDPFDSIPTFEDSSESSDFTLMSDCRCGKATSARNVNPSKRTRKPHKTTTPYPSNIDPFDSIPTFEDSTESSDFTLTSDCRCGKATSARYVNPSKRTRKPHKTTTPYPSNIDPFDSIPTFEDSSESSDFTFTSKSDCGCASDCSCRLPSF